MLVSDGATNQSEQCIDQEAAVNSIGIRSLPVLAKRSRTSPCVANLSSVDLEQLEAEDKLGCARGVLWAIVFEAALAAGAVLCWKFHLFSR